MKTILQNIQEDIAVEWKEIFDGFRVWHLRANKESKLSIGDHLERN